MKSGCQWLIQNLLQRAIHKSLTLRARSPSAFGFRPCLLGVCGLGVSDFLAPRRTKKTASLSVKRGVRKNSGERGARLLRRCFQDELSATVLLPRGFIMARISRTVFAKTDGIDAAGIDAQADELFPQSQCAPFSERPVVLFRAAFVAVTLDLDCGHAVGFQVICDRAHFW